jgi:hypothetical protein
MGILDKVKQVAGEAADAAKKGASQVQSKVEASQTRKKADEAAKKLGYLVFRERTGGTPAGEEAGKLVTEIADLEKQLAEMAARGEGEEPAAEGDKPAE